jgi:7-cyano-7-deazaguanine synthase
MKRAVVLLSGGVDSVTTLALAKAEGYDLYALSFDYGQRHKIELQLSRKNARKFDVKKHLIIKFNLRDIGGSALTDDIKVPKDSDGFSVTGNKLKNKIPVTPHPSRVTEIPVTYVPARNTIFLSFALSWAETLEAEIIYIGANAIDYSGYPDCRPEFIEAFEHLANLATRISVEGKVRFSICAPLIKMTKAEIIKKGAESGVDFSLTWSCYDPEIEIGPQGETFRPCMRCDSCRLRAMGFKEAGMVDPPVDITVM